MKSLRLATPRSCTVRKVVEVIAVRGTGIDGDPIREVRQYWSADEGDGALLAENDPQRAKDMDVP